MRCERRTSIRSILRPQAYAFLAEELVFPPAVIEQISTQREADFQAQVVFRAATSPPPRVTQAPALVERAWQAPKCTESMRSVSTSMPKKPRTSQNPRKVFKSTQGGQPSAAASKPSKQQHRWLRFDMSRRTRPVRPSRYFLSSLRSV